MLRTHQGYNFIINEHEKNQHVLLPFSSWPANNAQNKWRTKSTRTSSACTCKCADRRKWACPRRTWDFWGTQNRPAENRPTEIPGWAQNTGTVMALKYYVFGESEKLQIVTFFVPRHPGGVQGVIGDARTAYVHPSVGQSGDISVSHTLLLSGLLISP